MNPKYHGKAIVSGYINGRKFRPSNWAERVAESAGIFHADTKVFEYSPYLDPINHPQYGNGLVVDFDALDRDQPGVRDYLIWFIETNNLEVISLDEHDDAPTHEPV